MANLDMGMIGLGVMGKNLSLNLEEKGFSVAAWDAWPEPVRKFAKEAEGRQIHAFESLPEFVASLRRPRRIVMLVKAGQVVDDTITKLVPLLEPGDLLVDAGNEHFPNTERRAKELAGKGLRFFGMGVSGGEEGARHGPSMMPGGDREAYRELEPVLQKIAAQVPDGPCVAYCGPGGAGHYVKMVHNGIEYGDMQLIAEAYWLMKHLGGLSNAELADTFAEWNRGELDSFLIEITAKIFAKKDPETGGDLIDLILDAAAQKGTGRWTVQDAVELGAPIPTIASAVDARGVSSQKAERVAASKVLPGPALGAASGVDKQQLVADVRAALYASKCASYAQGMALIRAASELRGWGIQLGEMARIWKGGCIIRAAFLGRIQEAFARDAQLDNLLLDPSFREELAARQTGWRNVVALAARHGVPAPTTSISLAWYDSYRSERLSANLVQAQRDFFGAHTYVRTDREGAVHTEWTT
ncbi:MAG: NADP-dependent phosphogluconate dehydrogenase [Sorangiineae bacterium]|nr:NADP-dependent phosphogluconate dehydrogenase [Polyangiaceae bacterium]MEB2324261.1 NADP-dependent phosphogluconate dehydrogenase [Sorangiineae bacterium]